MKYPKLVRKQDCKTPIKITVYAEDIDEDGSPIIFETVETKCNYQSSAKRHQTDSEHFIEVAGVALIPDDIFEGISEITSGSVEILGEKRNVIKGTKARNPDGTVNYVRIEIQ